MGDNDNQAEPDVFLNQLSLLTEAAMATTAEAQQLRQEVKRERRPFQYVLGALVLLFMTQAYLEYQDTQAQNERSEQARIDRQNIVRTVNYLEDCLSPKRTQSDCQQRSRDNLGTAYDVIEERNRDLLIVALQCFRDPVNVDNAAIEDCILAETELRRKQREMMQ